MSRASETPAPQSLFMSLDEVAAQLAYKSRGPIYKLIYSGDLPAVAVGPAKKGVLRVKRADFEAYCQRQEAASAGRFGATA